MVKKTKRPARRYQVFVSHATADKWIAKVICEKIEALGAATFRDDRDISGGESIPDTIRREIEQSNDILVLLTPQSITRQWIMIEVGAAWGLSKRRRRMIPILYHVAFSDIPVIMQLMKAYVLNDFDQYLDDLRNRLAKERK
jgi:hypothetical protein